MDPKPNPAKKRVGQPHIQNKTRDTAGIKDFSLSVTHASLAPLNQTIRNWPNAMILCRKIHLT